MLFNLNGADDVITGQAKPLSDGSVAVVLYNSEPDQNFACEKAARKCHDGSTSNCCNEAVVGSKSHAITARWSEQVTMHTGPPT